jgi:SAM-dependent methyltransferase
MPAFPTSALSLIKCPDDGGDLSLGTEAATSVTDGEVACSRCSKRRRIEGGILRMVGALQGESAHEQAQRDVQARTETFDDSRRRETAAMLGAVDAVRTGRLLELGCGAGYYTAHLAGAFDEIVAVDFSLEALRVLGERALPNNRVALVQGDVGRFRVMSGAFDRSLSTLVSNLPSIDLVDSMLRLMADAVGTRGKVVFSTHYQGVNQIIRRMPKAGHYRNSGIYRYNFSASEVDTLAHRHFARVAVKRLGVCFPGLNRIDRAFGGKGQLLRLAERVPGLNLCAELLLVEAAGVRGFQ